MAISSLRPVMAAVPAVSRLTPGQVARRRLLAHGGLRVGGTYIAIVVLAAVLAPLLTMHDPAAQDLSIRLLDPVWRPHGTWEHVLGTDQAGRDIFARLLYGSRLSLLIGVFTVALSGLMGTALGLAAGFWGGWVDHAVMFLVTMRLTMPVVLVALVVVAVVGGSVTVLVLVIGCLLWDRFAIVVRTATQQIAKREFITSARCIGSSTGRILLREILPNLVGALVVVASIELAQAILLEAALSFLGLGVQPPHFTWGLMIAKAKSQLLFRPFLIAVPGVALVLLVLSVNLAGDALRDALAPDGRN